MTLVVPQVGSVEQLAKYLNQIFSLRLYSNNITPGITDVAADYTVVTGGGYANIPLNFVEWAISPGTPAVALYSDFQDFQFTGATGAPGTIYGYYLLDAEGILAWAERFAPGDVPFTPINGSLIRVRPRLTNTNLV